jgi:anti-sigma B factor antagonist
MAHDIFSIGHETALGTDFPILIVSGAINVNTFDKLENAIDELFNAKKHRIIIDVAGVKYVSSAGAGVLMNAYLQAQENGGKIVLTRLSPGVRDVLDLLNLHNVIPIADDIDGAVKLLM